MKKATIQMAPNVFWVGAIDWAVRNFHGYQTDEGSSYNAYLLNDSEFPTIIDTVKAAFADEFVERVRAVIPLESVRYIVMNHAENDHSSALPLVLKHFPNAVVVTNAVCRDNLCLLYPTLKSAKFQLVSDSIPLKLKDTVLAFLQVPLLHWPDSMFTYCESLQILFSNDGFGQHLASSERFVDELSYPDHALRLMKEYNANILGPFQQQLTKALKAASGLKIQTILTAHGCSWRGANLGTALEEYGKFSRNEQMQRKLAIIFQTIEGATAKMAATIAAAAKMPVSYMDLDVTGVTACALAAYESQYLAFGSPTIHGEIAPKVEAVVHYLRGLGLIKGRKVILFTTFGWADKASGLLKEQVEDAGGSILIQRQIKFKPTAEQLVSLYEEANSVLTEK